MELPKLITIREVNHDGMITFREIIEKKILLKTKLKLLHILAFDHDLQALVKDGFGISSLSFDDFYLNPSFQLIVPVKNRIEGTYKEQKLMSYLIYLSYLYQYDFVSLYPSSELYKLLSHLYLPFDIRCNLFSLLAHQEGEFFSSFVHELNRADVRNIIFETSKTLQLNLFSS